jgi:hypothetical protein
MEIPPNVKVTKTSLSAGWCFPFSTGDFLEAFYKTTLPIKINYENSKNEGCSLDKGFRIFSVTYHGTKSKTGNYFLVTASNINKKYRPVVHKNVFREVIPFVNNWIESVVNEEVIQLTSWVEVVYQNYTKFRTGPCIKILTNARRPNWIKHAIWSKEADFDKEIEVDEKETQERREKNKIEKQNKNFLKSAKKYREKKDSSIDKFYEEVRLIQQQEQAKKAKEEDEAWKIYEKIGE